MCGQRVHLNTICLIFMHPILSKIKHPACPCIPSALPYLYQNSICFKSQQPIYTQPSHQKSHEDTNSFTHHHTPPHLHRMPPHSAAAFTRSNRHGVLSPRAHADGSILQVHVRATRRRRCEVSGRRNEGRVHKIMRRARRM